MNKLLIILLIVIQAGIGFSQNFGNEMVSLSQIKADVKSKQYYYQDVLGWK